MVANGERSGPTGQELLAEFVQYGRQQPFEEIVRRYAGMVFNVCFRVTKDKHDAEDATQAVFLTLALQAKRGTDIKALGPWLQQVGKRLSLDTRRSKKRRKTREERHHDETMVRRESILNDAMPAPDMDELKTILNEELQKLPSKYRLPLILHYYGGMSRDEMATELNCKPSTLGVRIFRGREMLAGRLSGRGITVSGGMLGVMLGVCIKNAVGEKLIAATSFAASSMIGGHSGAGLASVAVIGLTRRAGSAVTIGKIKAATAAAVLAAASLGAGMQVMGILPKIDVSALFGRQVRKVLTPVLRPINRSIVPTLRAEAPTEKTVPVLTLAVVPDIRPAIVAVMPAPVEEPSRPSAIASFILPITATVTHWTASRSIDVEDSTITASDGPAKSDEPTFALASTYTLSGGGGGGGNSCGDFHMTSPPLSGGRSYFASTAPISLILMSPGNLYVPQASTERLRVHGGDVSTESKTLTATPAAVAAITGSIPADGGVVNVYDGIVRGYGTVPYCGALTIDGSIVADGSGVDRTLDLSTFTAVRKDVTNAATGGQSGLYASNKGKLTLPLLPAARAASSIFVWGDDPNAEKPDLVNAVRMVLNTDQSAPHSLSMLAVDRSDGPSLKGIGGATIGLWEIDGGTDINSAALSVRYNDWLVDALGGTDSTIQLWYLADGRTWTPVDGGPSSVDTTDHIVNGMGFDFDYFAVSVAPGKGVDVDKLLATPLAVAPGGGRSTAATTVVPEPASVAMLLIGVPLLARRRRSI